MYSHQPFRNVISSCCQLVGWRQPWMETVLLLWHWLLSTSSHCPHLPRTRSCNLECAFICVLYPTRPNHWDHGWYERREIHRAHLTNEGLMLPRITLSRSVIDLCSRAQTNKQTTLFQTLGFFSSLEPLWRQVQRLCLSSENKTRKYPSLLIARVGPAELPPNSTLLQIKQISSLNLPPLYL